MKKHIRKWLIASNIIISLFFCSSVFSQTAHTGMRGLTGMQLTADMAPGINLYNTLDAYGPLNLGLNSETYWGNPKTTLAMVTAMKERGFKTIRIPVTWYNHMGSAPDYKIDPLWMNRVEEVANYAFDNDMYVIINIHHDDYDPSKPGTWLCPTYEKQEVCTDQLEKVWSQIATRFKDYGDYLILETMNEPREIGSSNEWTGGSAEHREVVNSFNLAAVNAIRNTGGNNTTRFIMIPQVGANSGSAMSDLLIPNNDTSIIVSVHNYSPYWFCLDGSGSGSWGTASDISSLEKDIKAISDHFISKGQAVVLGEWGAGDKDNYSDRINYYNVFTNACIEGGITPVVWIFGFDRNKLSWTAPMIEEAILQEYDSALVRVEDIILNLALDTLYVGETLQLTATILPDSSNSQNILWTSKNKGIATINATGLVEAKGRGRGAIRATTIGKTADCSIIVLDTVSQLEFFAEAEDYVFQSGIQTESCSDTNGGQNIAYIENGDWSSYYIIIDSAGIYNFTARAATETAGGRIEIRANNKVLGETKVDGSKSNGWQDWYSTEAIELDFEKGAYDLKLTFKGGGGYLFNLNYLEINFNRPFNTSSIQNNSDNPGYDLQVYPNPFSDVLYISYVLSSSSDVSLSVLDIHGKVIQSLLKDYNKLPGNYTAQWNGEGVPNGIYFLNCTINGRTKTKKFFLNK